MGVLIMFNIPQKVIENEFAKYYTKNPIDISKYDTIDVTNEEFHNIFNESAVDSLSNLSDRGRCFLENPALAEFAIKMSDTGETILFKKTCIPYFEEKVNGKVNVFEPWMDIFYTDETTGEKCQESVGLAYTDMDANKASFLQFFGISMTDSKVNENYTSPFETNYNFCSFSLGVVFLVIQKFLYDRPTMFTEISHREVEMGVKVKKTKKQTLRKRIVKTVKTLRLNPIEYNNYVGKHKVITCPSWGVIGHTRTLKSGKQIWIKPYRKGKERNNPDAYSPKQYDLVTAI